MLAHVLRFIGCVVVSALAAAALGELTFPGPNPFVSASIWCGAWATVIASIMYVFSAFAWSDYYTVRKKKSIDAVTIARIAERGIRLALKEVEKEHGGPYPQREADLVGGRPIK